MSAVRSSASPVSVPSLVAPGLDGDRHRVPGGRRGELLLAGELQLDGASRAQHREGDDVLGQHSCLPPNPPPTRVATTRTRSRLKPEDPANLVPGQERHLRRRPQHQPSRRGADRIRRRCRSGGPAVEPADRGVRLKRDVLHPLGAEGPGVHHVGRREPGLGVAGHPVHLGAHVARREVRVQRRRAGRQGRGGFGDGRADLVVDRDERAAGLGRRDGLRDDGGDPLPVEPHRAVEDQRVVRVVVRVGVPGASRTASRGSPRS